MKNYSSFVLCLLLILSIAGNSYGQCPVTNFTGTFTPVNGQVLSGTYNINGIFYLPLGDTVWVEAYNVTFCGELDIHADSVRIEGVIMATGSGFPGGTGGAAGFCADSLNFQDCSLASQCLAIPAVVGGNAGLSGFGASPGIGGINATNGRGRKNSCNATSDRVGRVGGSGGGGGGGGGAYGGGGSSGGGGTSGTLPLASANSPDNPCIPANGTPIQVGAGGAGGVANPTIYGTINGSDLEMGSGGAGGGGGGRGFIYGQDGGNGGSGGGRIVIEAIYGLYISGNIHANGQAGEAGGKGGDSGESDRCCIDACPQVNEHTYVGAGGGGGGAGGGSGGGILIQSGGNISLTGLLDVSGGTGGAGGQGGLDGFWSYQEPPFICGTPGGVLTSVTTGAASNGTPGGNGGGGRIKIFYDNCALANIAPVAQIISGGVGADDGSYHVEATTTSPPSGMISSLISTQSICAGTNGDTINASFPSIYYNALYQWQYQNDCSGPWINISGNNFPYWIPSGLADTACVRVSVTYGICSTVYEDTIRINVVPAPFNFTIQNPNPSFCSGGNATLSLSPAPPANAVLQWYVNNTPIPAANGGNSPSVNVNASGNYHLIANIPGALCPAYSDTTTITVFSSPSATITAQNNATIFCEGGSGIPLSVNPVAGAGYQWLWNQNPAGLNSPNYTATDSGDFQCIITDINNCTDTSAVWSVSVFPKPVAQIDITPFSIYTHLSNFQTCQGDTVTLSYPGSTPNLFWTFNGNPLAGNQTSINVNTGGTYGLIVTDGPGCTDTASLNLNTIPVPVAIMSVSSNAFCPGDSVLLIASGGGNYTWTGIGSTNDSLYVSQPGVYCVTVSEPVLGCADSICSPGISQSSGTNATINNLTNTTVCQGDTVWLQGGGGGNYQWLLNGLAVSGATNALLGAVQSGNYSVIAYFSQNCRDTSSLISVNVQSSVTASLNIIGLNPTCQGDTVQLQASGGNNYVWLVPSGAAAGSGTLYNAVTPGDYRVVTFNPNGNCPDTSTVVSVAFTPAPVPVIGLMNGTNPACEGDLLALFCANYSSYQWFENGIPYSNAASVSTGITASYTVTVTDNNGCSGSSAPYSVVINPLPQPVITGDNQLCPGQSATLQVTGGNFVSWQWFNQNGGAIINNAVNPVYTTTQPDGYSVNVTDGNGCSGFAPVFILSPAPSPVVTLSATDSAGVCASDFGSYLVIASGADTYQWYRNNSLLSGQTNDSLIIQSPGNYWTIGTTLQGCNDTSNTTNYFYKPEPLAGISLTGNPVICSGKTLELFAVTQDSIVQWLKDGIEFAGSVPSVTVSAPGLYDLVVVNECGTDTTDAPITIQEQVYQVAFTHNPESDLYIGRPVHFYEQCSSGTVSFEWNFGTGAASNSPNPVYTYPLSDTFVVTLTGTNYLGCKDTANDTLIVYNRGDFYVPSAFSPNGDGYNDIFTVNGNEVASLLFSVYDRNGRLIYTFTQINEGWDGTIKGISAPEVVYTFTYKVTFTNQKAQNGSGTITLIR